MKIDWIKTIEKMQEMGYSEEEIEHIKKDTVDAICRFIDQERGISIYFKHKGAIVQLNGESALQAIKPKGLKKFLKGGWLKKVK